MTHQQATLDFEQLSHLISSGQFPLPTLPGVAIKVQRMIDDMNVSAAQIVAVVSSDPVIASQLIKTANSAAYAEKPKVNNVHAAISRLGYRALRNLVLNVTMLRLSSASLPVIRKTLAQFWVHSREVAALSYLLAKKQRHLNPDQAMLAGLIHDIGTLPICLYADESYLQLDSDTLESMIQRFRTPIGEKLLHAWNFPPELVAVVTEHENLQRASDSPQASYADIVTVANLLNRVTCKVTAWENVSALGRLGLDPLTCRNFYEQFGDDILSTQEMLFPR